ncbi:MAG: mycothiol conjugate amidase Mca [Acidimicrobiia bacterium]|nr:mycothiol conjugate amidase Mca [Acidimicrobiia bacterium]
MCIHAHPDDEASKGAPTIAKYVAMGHEASLVCATGGEEGDILNPAMDLEEVRADLHRVRLAELEASVKEIGYTECVMLGYRDSGMPDTDGNLHGGCFARADFDEAVGRFVAEIRRFRPHVIITYADDQQGYQHPDHLMVHDISIPAFDRAGDPSWYPEAGAPWTPMKLYYSMWTRARLDAWQAKYEELGLESPYDERWWERPDMDRRISTKIEIEAFYTVRSRALLAHATQIDPNEKFWFGLPDDHAAAAYPFEDYILALSRVPTGQYETDLLEGVDAGRQL